MALPRTTMVKSAAELSACDPRVQSFYCYWDEKRAGKSMPSRSCIDPTELCEYLPMVMLVDVVEDDRRYLYRLVGTKEAERRGSDPTGKPVAEASSGTSEQAIAFYDLICRHNLPVLLHSEYTQNQGKKMAKEQILGLPLSPDEKTVNMILVFTVTEWVRELAMS